MKDKKIAILGGDLRNKHLYRILKDESYNVVLLGHEDNQKNLFQEIKNSDIIIGPLPLCSDNEHIFAPGCKEKIRLLDVFRETGNSRLFFAGKITHEQMNMSKVFDVYLFDYLEREEFAIHNAVPTCEGAIKIAIDNTDITLYGSRILILGYGRIGKILCNTLRGMGADVYCYARKK